MPGACATLAVWASAWLAGTAGPDAVLDALTAWAPLHLVHAADRVAAGTTGLPGPDHGTVGPANLFALLRAAGDNDVRLVLPAPGDVRGLPAGTAFAAAALAAGEGVLVPGAGLGLVPVPEGREAVRWRAFVVPSDVRRADHTALSEAEHELRQAVRDSARALVELDVARSDRQARRHIETSLRQRPHLRWPVGTPPRSLRVLDTADEVAAILTAAAQDAPGGARTAPAATARDELLRPLWRAVRTARTAAVEEAVRVIRAGVPGR